MKSPKMGKLTPLAKSNQMPLMLNAACDMVYRQPMRNISVQTMMVVGLRFQPKRSVRNATTPSIRDMLLVSAANRSSI